MSPMRHDEARKGLRTVACHIFLGLKKRWKISKMLLVLPILAAALTSANAVAEPTAFCEEFSRLVHVTGPNGLDKFQLDETVFIGGKPGDERYFNIDVDGDDISDFIDRSCPGSTEMPADPCMLSIKLSSSGKTLEFRAWGFQLFRYHGQIFIAANADKTGRKTNIFRVVKAGFKLVCENL